jgi:DNA-binding NtrC family response regulator
MRKYCILLVDDEPNILSALQRMLLDDNRYEVITAGSGLEALEKTAQAKVDLAISDHRMPGMTGVDLLTQIRQRNPDSIRILLSGYTDIDALIGAINEGEVYRFVTKPWNNDDLKRLIDQALEQQGILKTVGSLVDNLRQALQKNGAVEIDSYRDGKNLCVKIHAEDQVVSEHTVSQLLNIFLEASLLKSGGEMSLFGLQFIGGVVTKHKGRIDLTVDMGKGVEITIQLPIAEGS